MRTKSQGVLLFVATIVAMAMIGCGDENPMQPLMHVDSDPPDLPPVDQRAPWRVELSGRGANSIWGASETSLYVNDGLDYVTHFDGDTWTVMPTGLEETIRNLWGTSDDNIYALSSEGIVHFDGAAWSVVQPSDQTLRSLWGSANDDIFAVGNGGTVFHYDGTAWLPVDVGVGWDLTHVDGSDRANVYVVGGVNGSQGYLRFDGAAWSIQILPHGSRTTSLAVRAGRAVVGDSSARVWEDSTVLFTAPAAAAELATLGSDVLGAVFDGGVFHWNTSMTVREAFPAPVRELWTAPWDRVYGVGPDGQIVAHDGRSWSFVRETRPAKQLNTIFGAPDGTLFAMGVASYALDGDEWSERALSTPYTVSAGWAVSRSFAIAVGQNGAIDHWDGTAWTSVPSPITGNLTDVWASSETDAFAVAFDTTVLHFDGTEWSAMTRLPFNLKAVHGTAPDDVYACGVRSVFHYDGSAWDETSIPTDTVLDVIWAESPTSVFVGGGDGVIFHYDGATWERTPTPTDAAILDLWVRGPGGVYALAEDGLILRFDGQQWRVRAMAPGRAALSLWGTDHEIVVAGYGTTVFRVEE